MKSARGALNRVGWGGTHHGYRPAAVTSYIKEDFERLSLGSGLCSKPHPQWMMSSFTSSYTHQDQPEHREDHVLDFHQAIIHQPCLLTSSPRPPLASEVLTTEQLYFMRRLRSAAPTVAAAVIIY